MKIAVYAIAKNEEQFVSSFCESAKDADLILIADTGSTDDTVKKAIEHGATVHHISIKPWRFDKARDACLALLPSDIDVCISLDLDETLQPGWRDKVEAAWTKETTRLRYKFDWGSGIIFMAEKIHARYGYLWHHPCHEALRPDARTTEVWGQIDDLLVVHNPDPTKSRGQYLDLLKMSVEEDPSCPRNAFYYARELTFYSMTQEAIEALHKYLAMPQAVWKNERAFAMRLLGNCTNDLAWYRRAVAEDPTVRETWCELAMACSKNQLWDECLSAAKSALAITQRQNFYTEEAVSWGSRPHDLLALAAHHLGLKDLAIKHGDIAANLEPADDRLISNLAFYKE